MQVTRSKILGLVIALSYLVTAVVLSGWDTEAVAILCLALSLPLAFIWFPDEIAAYSAIGARRPYARITETPAPMVTLVGWLLLVGYFPLIAYLTMRCG